MYYKYTNLQKRFVHRYIRTKFVIRSRHAFTFVELLITIGIMSVLSSFLIIQILNYRNERSFVHDAEIIAESLRFAEEKAKLGEQGLDWGVRFSGESPGLVEIFSGSSYSTSSVVEARSLSNMSSFTNPSASQTKNVLFATISGLPSTAHTVSIRKAGASGSVYTISVSTLGKISSRREEGITAMWEFDDGSGSAAHDASGNGKTGALTNFDFSGNSNWASLGKIAGALRFDGSNDFVQVGDPADESLDFGTGDFTLTAWVNLSSLPGAWKSILSKGAWGTAGYAMSVSDANYITCDIQGAGGSNQHYAFASAQIGWHMMACVYPRADKIYGYYDGALQGSGQAYGTGNANSVSNGELFMIGKRSAGNEFSGTLDEVRVYSRALTGPEIKELYESY